MTVEEPKNGAINRAAAISAPSVLSPTAKTSASSGSTPRAAPRDSTAVTQMNLVAGGVIRRIAPSQDAPVAQPSKGEKSALRAPQTGQYQSAGMFSKAVPESIPPSGSPSSGS